MGFQKGMSLPVVKGEVKTPPANWVGLFINRIRWCAAVISVDQAFEFICEQIRPVGEPASALSQAHVRAFFDRGMGF
jgi:hypothetical protein